MPVASPGGTQRPAVLVPCDSSTAGRETSTWRQKYRTLQQLFPRQSCIWVRQSCVLGATSLSAIFIPFSFFPLTIFTPDFLTDVSITAAFVLGHTSTVAPCSCCVCQAMGPSRRQPLKLFFLRQNEPFLLSLPPPGPGRDGGFGPHLPAHPPQRMLGQQKAEQPEAETSFRHNQVKNTYFSDKSSVPKW